MVTTGDVCHRRTKEAVGLASDVMKRRGGAIPYDDVVYTCVWSAGESKWNQEGDGKGDRYCWNDHINIVTTIYNDVGLHLQCMSKFQTLFQ